MSAGEYIAAEKLEVDFANCNLVEQIWVYGNSYEVSNQHAARAALVIFHDTCTELSLLERCNSTSRSLLVLHPVQILLFTVGIPSLHLF